MSPPGNPTLARASRAADAAISAGQIPPAYHDLLREYFTR